MPTDEGRFVEEWERDGRRITIRTARWSDLDSYAEMHRTLYQERVMAAPRNADMRVGGELLGKMLTHDAAGTGILLVAEADGRIVAEGTLTPSHGDRSITLGLLVLREYRDMGIGRRLMRALEVEARRLGKERMDLTVWSANPRAYHLYTSMGYREMGRFPRWIRSDLAPTGISDLVWMIKDL
ncbi:MAG: GNAT family N-acetyltransferase [Armatimonadetes bacterium]|nr:GNAT family N-acetyltransferase [Armatimonadota bacterium]